jgi:hypothetical protein
MSTPGRTRYRKIRYRKLDTENKNRKVTRAMPPAF